MDLTLYIFTSPGIDPFLSLKGLEKVPMDIKVKDKRDLSGVKVKTPWLGVLIAGEMFEKDLAAAIPAYLASNYECIWMFKETVGPMYFITPRLFRNVAGFKPFDLVPENVKSLKFTRALNGMIVDVR